MSSVHPKTVPSVTPFSSPATAEAQMTAFRNEVEQVRASLDGQLFFPPGSPKPCTVGGVVCRTSAQVIAAYTPTAKSCTPSEWLKIGDLVREGVRLAATPGPTTTYKRMKTVTAFALWCARFGVPLHAEMMFTPARVEHYVASQLATRTESSQAQARSELKNVARAGTTKAGWDRPARSLTRSTSSVPPYTSADISAFWDAALAQSTPRRRHVIATIMTLGLGAGLRSSEMLELRAEQVLSHPAHDGLLLIVLTDRLVPVRHDLAAMLLHLCDSHPSGRLIGGQHDKVSDYRQFRRMCDALDLPDALPVLSSNRLRTTWAVECLSAGVNPAEFCRMAGISITRPAALVRFLTHVPTRDTSDGWMLAAAGLPMGGGNA